METAQESRLQLKMRTVDTGRCEVAGCVQSIDAAGSKQLCNYGSKQGRRVKVRSVALSVAQPGITAGPRRSIVRFNGSISKQHPGCTPHTPLPHLSMTLWAQVSTYSTGGFSASLQFNAQFQRNCDEIWLVKFDFTPKKNVTHESLVHESNMQCSLDQDNTHKGLITS